MAHSNRPLDLANEQLNITEVFSRAGVDVQRSPNASVVGLEAGVGADLWDDQQLHDAMQMFWSRYKSRAQWALWMLFAHRHFNESLLGIMFDFNHPKMNTRSTPISARVRRCSAKGLPNRCRRATRSRKSGSGRELFFAAVHEIGHCFNLFHSYGKKPRKLVE